MTGTPAFSASFAPIDEYSFRENTRSLAPCGKIRIECPSLMRATPSLNTCSRSSLGDLRPSGISPMCAAARFRAGRRESEAFTNTLNGPYVRSTGGSIMVSSVDMWLLRYTTGPLYPLRFSHPSAVTFIP